MKKYIQTKIIWVQDNGEFVITEFELVRFYDWTKLHFQKLSNKAKTNTTSWKKLPDASRVAQWKRAGPITQRSEDQNLSLLEIFLFHKRTIIECLKTFYFLFVLVAHQSNQRKTMQSGTSAGENVRNSIDHNPEVGGSKPRSTSIFYFSKDVWRCLTSFFLLIIHQSN